MLTSPRLLRRRPKAAQRKKPEALELDEIRTFVGRKKRRVGRWLALERASRRIMVWVLGYRGAATARRLWAALLRRYHRHCCYYTDQREAYTKVLLLQHHRPRPKGSGNTSLVEAIHCSLRQRCDVLVRKSCSSSKSLSMHTTQIKIVIDNYNCTLHRSPPNCRSNGRMVCCKVLGSVVVTNHSFAHKALKLAKRRGG